MDKKIFDQLLAGSTKEGELCKPLFGGRIECFACGHRCGISEGRSGTCRVRLNRAGKLVVPSGYVAALQDDPIEKKPFYHALPGSRALSFGMLGCNYHCSFCQNWVTTQTLRDPEAVSDIIEIKKEKIVQLALEQRCASIISTYNEPLITSEWAVEIFKEAKRQGLVTGYVSNGHATPEVLDYLRPWLDLFKVDLKCFNERGYRELGGTLETVCESIRGVHERKFWMEIVTLLVPGFNDSPDEIKGMAGFIASVSPDIPWHVTAFHPDYKMTDCDGASSELIMHAAELGRESGLRYVYTGNLPGMTGDGENTYCHGCRALLIKRCGFRVLEDRLSSNGGKCPACQAKIPGFWTNKTIQ
jgi:pyruvate formate lyase activating enzyme